MQLKIKCYKKYHKLNQIINKYPKKNKTNSSKFAKLNKKIINKYRKVNKIIYINNEIIKQLRKKLYLQFVILIDLFVN